MSYEKKASVMSVEQVCDFLKERGIDTNIIQNFLREKIDGCTVEKITNEDLQSLGLTAFGDIIHLREFCSSCSSANGKPVEPREKRKKLLQLLKNARKPTSDGQREQRKPGRPERESKMVTAGLRINKGTAFIQVKKPLGDKNLISMRINQSATYEQMLNLLVSTFFPQGRNPIVGTLDEYHDFSVVNASNVLLTESAGITAEELTLRGYVDKKMVSGMPRIHLLCKKMEGNGNDAPMDVADQVTPQGDSFGMNSTGEVQAVFSSTTVSLTEPTASPATSDAPAALSAAPPGALTGVPPVAQADQAIPSRIFLDMTSSGEVWAALTSTPVSSTGPLPTASPEPVHAPVALSEAQPGAVPVASVEAPLEDSAGLRDSPTQSSWESDGFPTMIRRRCRRTRLSLNRGNESSNSDDVQIVSERDQTQIHDSHSSIEHILGTCLAKEISSSDTPVPNMVNVCRDNILPKAMKLFNKETFKDEEPLSVRFGGEIGIDNGGLSREFMTLAIKSLKDSGIFCGDQAKDLYLDYYALEKRMYYAAGRMISYFIVHHGPVPHFFSERLYSAVAQTEDYNSESSITINDITDQDLKENILRIVESNEDEYADIVSSLQQLIDAAGCTALSFKWEHRPLLVKGLIRFCVIVRTSPALEQFCKGLAKLRVLEHIREYPQIMKPIFVHEPVRLTSQVVLDLFKPTFSEMGSNRRLLESRTHVMFMDFLDKLEEEDDGLPKLLSWATGMSEIPLLGFKENPALHFEHEEDLVGDEIYRRGLPSANTCALVLRIPVMDDEDTFQQNMQNAMEHYIFSTT